MIEQGAGRKVRVCVFVLVCAGVRISTSNGRSKVDTLSSSFETRFIPLLD